MARLTPELAKTLARQLYDYALADDAAVSIAHIVGATASYLRRVETLNLAGVQPSFGYVTLISEAERLNGPINAND